MMADALAVLLGLVTGAAMSVAVSCVWCVLLLPARLQDCFQAASPRSLTWALGSGLVFSTLANALEVTLLLPDALASVFFLPSGMFVGMLASALGEILEVAPVMMRRFRLGDVSTAFRFVIMLAKGLGAIIATLTFTL